MLLIFGVGVIGGCAHQNMIVILLDGHRSSTKLTPVPPAYGGDAMQTARGMARFDRLLTTQ